jgi:uncharacterized membrane-anchored protein
VSAADHDIPNRGRVQADNREVKPEDITEANRPFYMLLVGGLLVVLLFGLVAWFVLALRGTAMPEGMAVLIGSVGGGVVGLLTASASKK